MATRMNKHGCYNRAPLGREYYALDGYVDETRTQVKTVTVPHDFKPGCQYTQSYPDARCTGCIHEAKR